MFREIFAGRRGIDKVIALAVAGADIFGVSPSLEDDGGDVGKRSSTAIVLSKDMRAILPTGH